jgi:hypothetical protein
VWSSLKRSFHSRFKGPRVPKKPQFTHELVKLTTIIPLEDNTRKYCSAHAQWSSVKVQQHNKDSNLFNAVLFVFKIGLKHVFLTKFKTSCKQKQKCLK